MMVMHEFSARWVGSLTRRMRTGGSRMGRWRMDDMTGGGGGEAREREREIELCGFGGLYGCLPFR
jgi:hypothetical protein